LFQVKNKFLKQIIGSILDLLPIFVVIFIFQIFVLQQPILVLGLTLFIQGLEKSLFPIGENMAYAFAKKGSIPWLLAFAFALGFGTTAAEPALISVANEAARIASDGGMIQSSEQAQIDYATGLRFTIASSVGFAILLGVLRIIRGWPLHYLIIPGYIGVVIMTFIAPDAIIGIAYDSGGVTTSTITVPLVTALGVGLASAIQGRNPLTDGFGLIAFASLTPMIFVMAYGMVI